jgi:hypothetical protein
MRDSLEKPPVSRKKVAWFASRPVVLPQGDTLEQIFWQRIVV